MRKNLSKFAPAVFWAGVIVLLLGVIVIVSGATAGSGRGPVPTEYMLIGGVALLIVSALMRPTAVRTALGIRGVRYGGNALILTLAILAILGIVNYFGTQARFNWRQDFTVNKQFTLSEQTQQVLRNLKQPVKATAFYSASNPRQEAKDRLDEYARSSDGKFTYEFVDPFDKPDLARQLAVTRDGGIVFAAGSKKQEAISTSESDFTGAILKVIADVPRVVYFVAGHKERDPNESGDNGYSTVRAWIEKDNYSIGTLSLLITPTIPVSATVVVVAGPQSALADSETKVLSDYMDQGGRLMLLGDPSDPVALGDALVKWGVKFENNEVVDPMQFFQTPVIPAVSQYPFSTITQKMNGLQTLFPLARSVTRTDPPPTGITTQPLVQTSAQAWGETNLDPNTQPVYNEGKDQKGPVDIMVSVEGTLPAVAPAAPAARKTRIVAIGTSEFVANRILNAQQLRGFRNIDLFMNAVNWLAEEESLIAIRPVPPDQRSVVFTGSQLTAVLLLTVVFLPALVLIGGLSVWWRRR